jgi:murein DD-endopeptidase MepM/ murein hydrolase activator NlpD
MRIRIALAAAIAVGAAATTAAQRPAALDIRFSPAGHVYMAQENRQFGIASLQIQNIAIVNTSSAPVRLDEILIEVLSRDDVVRVERHPARLIESSWTRLKSYLDLPGSLKAEESRYRFRELLGTDVTLSSTTTLAPQTAMYLSHRFAFVDAGVAMVNGRPTPVGPDRVRVSVRAFSVDGAPVTAQNDLRIVNYVPVTEYHFPVKGRWYIASSGSVRSHHRVQPVHEFALDLIQIGDGGASYEGSGTVHSDYYAFGKDVYVVADGVVEAVLDGIKDTRLRRADESVDAYRAAVLQPMVAADTPHGTGGNQVIVAHAGGEYSSYAHLKEGSIRVRKGDRVTRGQVLAQIGLSGDGFQPHLHFQITDGPDINYARGIPAIFANVRPVRFSSTIDDDGRRQLQTGEFIQTTD